MARESRLDPQLTLWHRTPASDAPVQSANSFTLDTCQRSLSIGDAPLNRRDFSRHVGEDAYRLMLEISTGLRSELAGETNVFGQIKRAWDEQQYATAAAHTPWMQQWFSDTKAIRAKHLQGVGGDSYASLCRQLLDLKPRANIFIVGGGELASAILARFTRHACTLFVRSSPRFEVPARVTVEALEALPDRIANADAIIFCIPPSAEWERGLVTACSAFPCPLVHLGYRETQPGPLAHLGHWHTLDALFALQRQRANIRLLKLAAAKRACGQRAQQLFLELARANLPTARAQ